MSSIELVGISKGFSYCSGTLINQSYLVSERSADDGRPLELYHFQNTVDLTIWSYNSGDTDISYGGRTYIKELIHRSSIALNTNSLKTRVNITFSLTNSFVRNYIQEPIEGIVQLIIYRQHHGSYIVYWKGYVASIKFHPKIAVVSASLKTSRLKRYGLMRKFTRSCGLALYSTWCMISVDDSDYYVDDNISTVSGTTITATAFGTKTDGWFLGGKFKTDDSRCLQKIIYHVGTTIKIGRAISSLSVGDGFRAWAGCNHSQSICDTKFNNKLNYGGQLYLPDKNPFSGDPIV